MSPESIRKLLESVQQGALSVEDGLQRLRALPFQDLAFAKIDHHRHLRCGSPEVIYSEGKTTEQVLAIFTQCAASGNNVLATRATQDVYDTIRQSHPKAEYHALARCIILRQGESKVSKGVIALVAAGTADLPVAEEARVTATVMHQSVCTYYDVGVAGVHRLLAHTEELQKSRVIIVVAGMEGALPSVVGGLVQAPVIAVPTSVGYGAHLQGIAPLLTMLNSCASNVVAVNIDNGFKAGYVASLINQLAEDAQ